MEKSGHLICGLSFMETVYSKAVKHEKTIYTNTWYFCRRAVGILRYAGLYNHDID